MNYRLAEYIHGRDCFDSTLQSIDSTRIEVHLGLQATTGPGLSDPGRR
jgi:hypothetical protein